MLICPNCKTVNEDSTAACIRCSQDLQPRSWWRRIVDSFTGKSFAPGPPPPAVKTAAGEPQRLQLFEEWLEYALEREGVVVFSSGQDCYVQYSVSRERIRGEVGTMPWKEIFEEPMPESVGRQLVQKGFQAPTGGEVNYWKEFHQRDARSEAALTEWAFQEVFSEDRNYNVKVALAEFE